MFILFLQVDQRLAMSATGNVVGDDKLEREREFHILYIYKTEYGQIILKLPKNWETDIYVWPPHSYSNHFSSELI